MMPIEFRNIISLKGPVGKINQDLLVEYEKNVFQMWNILRARPMLDFWGQSSPELTNKTLALYTAICILYEFHGHCGFFYTLWRGSVR